MRRASASAVVAVVLVAVIGLVPSSIALAQSGTLQLKKQVGPQDLKAMRLLAAKLSAGGWTPIERAPGDCTIAIARAASKSAWVARLGCADYGDFAAAGFMMGQLSSTAPLTGVKVTATVEITHITGSVDFHARFGRAGSSPAHVGKRINAPGTYTISAGPFDLQASESYEAGAELVSVRGGNDFVAVAGKITEIKWDF